MREIHRELSRSHLKDLPAIQQYARWLRWRRLINNYFYLAPQMHWVRASRSAHWV